MSLIADFLLVAGALGATFYCFVLSRRLAKFNDLERGVGGAVAVLSAQVDDMTKTLVRAEAAAKSSTSSLDELTGRAEGAAKRLELLVASMHDLPDPGQRPVATAPSRPPEIPTPKVAEPNQTTASGAPELLFLRHRAAPAEAQQ